MSKTQRIHVIDAIRGLAVLGILFANIQSWSGYKYITYDQIAQLPYADLDGLFYSLHLWIVDGKFYAIFSMLFGAGFGLQYMKNRERLDSFLPMYRRRLALLLVFGLLHAFFWSGDILTLYALLAFAMVLLRDLDSRQALYLALGLLAFFALPQCLMLVLGHGSPPPSDLAHKVYPDMSPQEVAAGLGTGNWAQYLQTNLHNLYWRWMDFLPNGRVSRVLGFFMLGFCLALSGYFINRVNSLKWLFIWGITGIALSAAAFSLQANMTRWASSGMDVIAKLLMVAAQTTLGLAYMSVVGVMYESSIGRNLLYPLTLIGRMAFTNYLLQSVIGIILFAGVGLGYYGSMGLAQLWLLALCIYAAQVVFSSIWLHFFKQGPVEWLWGCLTKKRFTVNRKFLLSPS